LYTIKQASSRSGVPVQLLRAWERRYGVVEPARTDSGYRLYDEGSISRLRAMRSLVDQGWAPSTAAAHVRGLDDDGVAALLGRVPTPDAAAEAPPANGIASKLRTEFVEAAGELDEAAVERVLDQMFASGSYEQVTTDMVMPALVDLGEAWADGRVDVSGEHAASGAVQRRLGAAFMAAGAPGDGEDLVLVGMPPSGRHDLGALVFATTARRGGLSVRYLGADLPVQDWVDAVERTRARAVVMGVLVRTDVRSAAEVVRAVRAVDPGVVIALGGRRAASVPVDGAGPVMILPDDMADAVGALREAIRADA
jgi:DNA-binding transcriptional MerR regulator/methylmalonyl-CoA mutase cobalamin-binding subunit